MIAVEEAQRQILERCHPQPPQVRALLAALDHVLAEDIVSDIDSPPHDKSMVDGYAVQSADLADGEARCTVLEEVTAGAVPDDIAYR